MFKNLQNKKELNLLIIVFVIIGIFGVAVKYFEFYNIKIISATTTDIYEHPLKVSNAALTIKLDVYKIHRDMKDIVLSLSNEELSALIEEVNSHEQRVYENFNIIEHNILGDDGFILEKNTRKLFDAWKPIRDEVISLMKNDKRDDAIAITKGKGAKHVLKLEAAAFELYAYAHDKAIGFKNKSESSFKILKTINLLISILFFFLFILIAYYIIQRISKFIFKEERYRYALEATNDGLWDWNLVTNEVYYSPRWKSMLGYSDDELENTLETWKNLIHPDDKKQAILDIELSHENKTKQYKNIHRLKHKDGHWVWIETRGQTMFDENSKPVRMIGSHINISEEKELHEELFEINKKLTNIAENIPGVIYTFQSFADGRSCFPFASEHIYDIYGVTAQEVQEDATKAFDVLHPQDFEHIANTIQTSSEELTLWQDEYRVVHPDKGIIWVKGIAKPEKQLDGSVLWYGYIYDVTKEKIVENEILRLKDLYDNVIDSVDNLIFVKDVNFVYITCNKAFEKFIGKPKDQIIGKSDYDIVDKELADFFREHDEIMLSNNKPKSNFEWVTYPDGEKFYLLTVKSPLINTEGHQLGLVGNSADFTEQQHLYELLQESQSLAKVGSFEYDLLEDKLTCSDEIFKIYGFSDFKMKLDKETFVKRQHPDDMQKAEEDFQNSLHSQEMTIAHNRIIRYDNQEVRYVEHRWKTQYDDSGNAVKTIGTTQDVTEQKAIQQSLKIEKYRYEMAEKIAHLGSWEQNNLDNTLQWSDEVYRIFEIDISEKMTFDHFMERVHPEDRDSVSQTFQKSVQEHVPYHLTHRLLFPDGRIKHVLEHAKHFYDDNNYMYTIGTVQDITQEYKTKELLQQKKRELETIFNEAPNPMMLHNEDGKVLMVNKVWKKLTGYSFDDIDTIEKWTKNAYGEKMPVVKEYIDKLYGLDSAVDEGEYSINTKNGDSIIWQFSSAPIGIIDNKRTVISSAMDITELKHKDEMLITQSRSAAMGEMIGMIAHQWRQPLTIISMDANNMLLDIALDDLDITQVKEHSNNIVMQTQHLSKTIDDFRNFFKPDKSILKIKPQEILEETYTIVKDSLANHNITLKTSYASESKVDAYPRELMQVFVNIITNAKDALLFKKSEGAQIDVKVFEDEKYVTTEICDNGGGIDEAILSKIFDPYFTTKDEKTGTGLGLYMSKMIIHDHLHGEIEAFNQNDGVCFSVKLPK